MAVMIPFGGGGGEKTIKRYYEEPLEVKSPIVLSQHNYWRQAVGTATIYLYYKSTGILRPFNNLIDLDKNVQPWVIYESQTQSTQNVTSTSNYSFSLQNVKINRFDENGIQEYIYSAESGSISGSASATWGFDAYGISNNTLIAQNNNHCKMIWPTISSMASLSGKTKENAYLFYMPCEDCSKYNSSYRIIKVSFSGMSRGLAPAESIFCIGDTIYFPVLFVRESDNEFLVYIYKIDNVNSKIENSSFGGAIDATFVCSLDIGIGIISTASSSTYRISTPIKRDNKIYYWIGVYDGVSYYDAYIEYNINNNTSRVLKIQNSYMPYQSIFENLTGASSNNYGKIVNGEIFLNVTDIKNVPSTTLFGRLDIMNWELANEKSLIVKDDLTGYNPVILESSALIPASAKRPKIWVDNYAYRNYCSIASMASPINRAPRVNFITDAPTVKLAKMLI